MDSIPPDSPPPLVDKEYTTGEEAPLLTPEEVRSWIIHHDHDFLVLNKPGGVVCHPSKNGPWSSLVGACRETFGLERIHLAHRLDRETSGLIILALHRKSARRIQMAFERKEVGKLYLGIASGVLKDEVEVDQPLAKDLESEVYVKQTVRSSRSAQKARTLFQPLWTGVDRSFLLILPRTGRKHQIRAHAAWLGHPLRGDKIYGPDDQWYLRFIEGGWTPAMAKALALPRQALHAALLQFRDEEGQTVRFYAPLPPDMAADLSQGGCPLSESERNHLTQQAADQWFAANPPSRHP